MKITVAIATTGRPHTVSCAIADLTRQTRLPDRTIISAASASDVDETALKSGLLAVTLIHGRRGLTVQRNAVLDALEDEDILLFLDDDFVMADDFLEKLSIVFAQNPDVAVATGGVLADGIGTRGLELAEARAIIAAAGTRPSRKLLPVNNGYGCNMAFRCAPIRDHILRFDETLPLYGWLEDIDFSRKVAAYGRCVKAPILRGVHLGTKSGRTCGVKLGYSQVANPIYLTGRATMRRGHAMRIISRNIAANAVKSLRPEPWVDRRGRLRGNLLALRDLLAGRIDPQRVLSLVSGPHAPA